MMKRIRLTGSAKQVLRLLGKGICLCPLDMERHAFNLGALELENKKLAICHQEEGGGFVVARITDKGRQYIATNPKLTNPIDWKWIVGTGIAFIALIVSIIALFVACNK